MSDTEIVISVGFPARPTRDMRGEGRRTQVSASRSNRARSPSLRRHDRPTILGRSSGGMPIVTG